MYNVDFSDHYQMPDTVMFEGPGDVSLSVLGTINTLITPLIGLLCLLAWLKVRSLQRRHDLEAAVAAKSLRQAQTLSETNLSETQETPEVRFDNVGNVSF
eukprot:TRINITY_DN15584_c0_g2_i2.p1 TRINITY_DN15584_c0_g2~~TRINITY_DN15584_c0_g2_i2.p1  ORF type:complete len:100 (+),score=16.88 TRINITY_DN15584_c0_g2_i2:123-422(+)